MNEMTHLDYLCALSDDQFDKLITDVAELPSQVIEHE